ncbi:hypothetical protein KWG64_07280 [Rahnella sp. PD12R]|uniref:hypothetical protein n=1 Tax=Rahnella sp. PD12R TaxID=2855688 RepID=UPI001C453AB9|nr:hypothetical protein [Rahnella sp. PD12R]MBV6817744.1 hypothetical protein [Rahnella sp. PD12R]
MTDTTDIAALMRDMRDLADRIVECQGENSDGEEIIHLYDQSDTTFKAQNILLALNAFEAERQRADANAQEIRKLEFQWEHRAPTQWAYDQACTALHAQRERAEKSEAELAALKGDQVPVGVYNQHLFNLEGSAVLFSINKSVESGFVSESGDLTRNHAYLFTAPQKPVVPVGFLFVVKATGAVIYSIADAAIEGTQLIGQIYGDAAINAAGGIVKDGE